MTDLYTQESKTEAPQPEPYLSMLHAWGLMVLLLILFMILSSLLSRVPSPTLSRYSHWSHICLVQCVAGWLTAKSGAILAGFSLTSLLFSKRTSSSLLLPLAVATIGVVILASELGNILNWIHPISQEYLKMLEEVGKQNRAGVLFAIGVVAPIFEELIFRGVILEGLRVRYSLRAAVVTSAVLFGMVHYEPWAAVNAFLLGLFFAWLKLRTGSLLLCIFSHSLYNSLPFLLDRVITSEIPGFNTVPTAEAVFQPIWLDIIGVLLLLAGISMIRSMVDSEKQEPVPSA